MLNNVSNIINNMNIAKLNKVVILFDVSFMTNTENMLKLVEETSCRLILLASRDNLPETILSRCKNILKIPFAEKDDFDLFESSNEIIIKIGNFKRNIPLPDVVRKYSISNAKFENGELNIIFS